MKDIKIKSDQPIPPLFLSDKGLAKIKEARESNKGIWPEWLLKEIKKAETSAK